MEKLKFSKKIRNGVSAAVGAAVLVGCGNTYGAGAVAEEGCVDSVTTYQLEDGQGLHIGVDDIYVRNFFGDDVELTRHGNQIYAESFDETVLRLGQLESELGEVHRITVGETPVTGEFIEDGQVVGFEFSLAGDLMQVELEWVCSQE